MNEKSPRQFRLLITISVLFTVLIVTFGLFFRQLIYWQTSEMLLEESDRYFSQVRDQLLLDFLSTRKSVHQTVRILGKTEIISAENLDQRLESVPVFYEAITADPYLSALQVGYDNGDFFIVRALDSRLRELFKAPPEADVIVDNITTGGGNKRVLQRILYNKSMDMLGHTRLQSTAYDPRTRPWFKIALTSDQPVGTEPYFFKFMQQTGLTIGYRPAGADAVIAGDISLYHLSQTLANHQQTPRSELILLDKSGNDYWVTAYKDPDKLMTKPPGNQERSRAADMGTPVLDYATTLPNILDSFYTFSYDNENWLGSTRNLNMEGRENFYLVSLAPEKEILKDARKLQNKVLTYTFIMILLAIPFTWFLARKISSPIKLLSEETRRICRFDFNSQKRSHSIIKEVEELGQAMDMMELTIGKFISLITSLASEQDFDKLLKRINEEIMTISEADGAFSYVVDEASNSLVPGAVQTRVKGSLDPEILPTYDLGGNGALVQILDKGERVVEPLNVVITDDRLARESGLKSAQVIVIPERNRRKQAIGVLCLIFNNERQIDSEEQEGRLAFIDALSGFGAVTLESRQMLRMQKNLLESFIKLLAGAIDSKSPYTGGHCQRVPVLTKLIAQKACESQDDAFTHFSITDEQWEALHIASWLHDCGKVTTPEFVVDKATKLETIYDRIHEIRMRFEVLKRDAHIRYWEQRTQGDDEERARQQLESVWQELDDEFAFVAECNLGGEYMAPEKIARLQQIAGRTWIRTIDDRIGISWEEGQRKGRTAPPSLPVEESLIADRDDHLFIRPEQEKVSDQNDYGFVLDVPKYLYNRGELHNLSVARGTLTGEERYQINDHIVQTIIMLKKLPYPKHLKEVPDIAGGHHEKIDGTGYPRKLTGDQMSLTAKMMVIADIFEALTASDRPYKKSKTLSEALKIMGFMEKDHHIDSNLFRLFLTSGAYLDYAREYMNPEQIDEVDIHAFIQP
jgi:HD-GYP domain-containing protein (c-di-GMP phosphodiesterase class II)